MINIEETGRDHDYDWAILEPATARSLVQAVGRVKRHREIEATHFNVQLMSKPIKAIDNEQSLGNDLCWNNPGLENEGLYLTFDEKSKKLTLSTEFNLLIQQANIKYAFEQPVNIVDNLSKELSEQYVFSDICLNANDTNCLTNYEYVSHFKALSYLDQSKYNSYKLFEQNGVAKLSNSHAQSTYFRKSSLTNITVSFHHLTYDTDTTHLTTLPYYAPTVEEEHYHKKLLINELKKGKVIEHYKVDNMIYPLESNIVLDETNKLLNIINPSDNKECKSPHALNSLFTTQLDSSFMIALTKGYTPKFSYMTGFYKVLSI